MIIYVSGADDSFRLCTRFKIFSNVLEADIANEGLGEVIIVMDGMIKKLLKQLYESINKSGGEIAVSSPQYKQSQIDELVSMGYLSKIDASTLDGWTYILRPTYEGETASSEPVNPIKDRVEELIRRGEEIGQRESHSSGSPFNVITVSGPMYEKWMGEINILNERHLKDHPMHDSIHTSYFQRNTRAGAYNHMMGHLRAVASDDEFFEKKDIKREENNYMSNTPLETMLTDDISRCEAFLNNPLVEEDGRSIYMDITARYDSVIPNFGNGLYQYISSEHFYDPDISGETLIFNLNNLMNKMKSYLATKFPSSNRERGTNKVLHKRNNKVFIVHGHDNAAVSDMARTLEKAGFEAIILHEQADAGLTIIEKIERYSDVGFAVILYTECDLGRAKEAAIEDEKFRARQNVVFEHGYLIGKLGRKNVCALIKGKVEIPGDISGVVYVQMDNAGAWRIQLGKNMKEAGMAVDFNKLCD